MKIKVVVVRMLNAMRVERDELCEKLEAANVKVRFLESRLLSLSDEPGTPLERASDALQGEVKTTT